MSRRAKSGEVWLIDFGTPVGSEQAGRRPGVVVGSRLHCSFPIEMVIVAPCTSVNRGLPHHVPIDWRAAGLDRPTFVRTEDLRSVSERRLSDRGPVGRVADVELTRIRRFVQMMVGE